MGKSNRIYLGLTAVDVLLLSTFLFAQGGKQTPPAGAAMMDQCKSMMAMHEKMQAEMKSMNDELDKLVTAMNKAPEGNKKVDAITAVINKMAEQRRSMFQKMSDMHMQDMQHMGKHMQEGASSMSMCPMMKGMQGGKSDDQHEQHKAHKG